MNEQEQQPQYTNQTPPPLIKKGMSTGAAIVLGISGIIIAIIIAGAIIFASGAKTIRDFDFENFDGFEAEVNHQNETTNVQVNVKPKNTDTYKDSVLQLEYPDSYTLSKNEAGVIQITSIPVPDVDEGACQQIVDEQMRAQCLNPTYSISPNIAIEFTEGDPAQLWSDIADFDANIQPSVILGGKVWQRYVVGGEFGGQTTYATATDRGLIVASYIHRDSPGGTQFDYLRNETYQLSFEEQKELLEQILATVQLN